ncbi:hypothetical protein GCM10020358_55320 [Amorphoplanes nipponensis]|uniref:Uncharacterized protein n=1 Tax=Actinoplanes nipponensis TaxID=135950 RepID=A0A919JRN7_9ACTN|nr:hypothetical protein [Actinoplanes nipponensis]GIE54205.1 hypothetical protein Ani05nite_77390 [Actinoplanes nipponensis]
MNPLTMPPAERDLPPGRAARMRAEVLAAARGSRPRVPRRLLVAAAAVLTLLAAVAVSVEVRREDSTQILAMGPGELDGSLRGAAQRCLEWARPNGPGGAPDPQFVPVSLADVAIAARRGRWIQVLFLNRAGYLGCEASLDHGRLSSGGVGGEAWPHRGWLPGPVQRLSLSSTEADGGSVSVLGRVSARVARLVLEHGNGRTTTARLRDGAFGLISRTDDVGEDAELVSYDAAGREIDRRRLFAYGEQFPHCYTDPAGTVIYGDPGPDCRPADPWNR